MHSTRCNGGGGAVWVTHAGDTQEKTLVRLCVSACAWQYVGACVRFVCVCACVCVRASVRACVRACVCLAIYACVRVYMRACVACV